MHGGKRRIGALDVNLEAAIRLALTADRAACAEEGARYEWDLCTDRFLEGLAWRHGAGHPAANDVVLGDEVKPAVAKLEAGKSTKT